MKKLIIANWKMHPLDEKQARALAKAEDRTDIVIAPPFPFLSAVGKALKKAVLGAQDVFWEDPEEGGAFTGEVSPTMLQNLGVRFVIVGHSERRRIIGETDDQIQKKVQAALGAGIEPVLCVGETDTIRSKGTDAAQRFVRTQLERALAGTRGMLRRVIIAYEPLWAIGTGVSDTVRDIAAMQEEIRKTAQAITACKRVLVLYGGSVNAESIAGILGRGGVDGALIGGASLDIREFQKMLSRREYR